MAALEVAFSVVLLAGAGLLMQSVLRMSSANLGFQPDGLVAARLTLPRDRYRDAGARVRFYRALEQKAAALPDVESAAVTSQLAPAAGGTDTLEVFGKSGETRNAPHDVITQFVGADYFRTVGTRVLAGGFIPDIEASRPREAVVNEALAARYFPAGDAIGSRIRVGNENEQWLTVVGIVETERRITAYNEMQWVAQPAVYRLAELDPPDGVWLLARTRGGQAGVGAELRREVTFIDSEVAMGETETVRHALGIYLSYPRFRALVFGGFAVFALLLAAVGLHGVLAELVFLTDSRRSARDERPPSELSFIKRCLHRGCFLSVAPCCQAALLSHPPAPDSTQRAP
jgi:putative ABC transport system permease protein